MSWANAWRHPAFAVSMTGIAVMVVAGIAQGNESTVAAAGLLLFIYGLVLTWIGGRG